MVGQRSTVTCRSHRNVGKPVVWISSSPTKGGSSTNFEQRPALGSRALCSFLARSTKVGPSQKRGLDQAASNRFHEGSSSAIHTFCCGVPLTLGLACISRKTLGTSPLHRVRHAIGSLCTVHNRHCACCSPLSSALRLPIRVMRRTATQPSQTLRTPRAGARQ
jgi:hypothetical protein